MKGLLLGIAIICLSVNLNAQITQGSVLFSGKAHYNKSQESHSIPSNPIRESKFESFSVLPSFGLFVSKSILMGVGLKAEFNSNSYLVQSVQTNFLGQFSTISSYDEKSKMFFINPFFTRFNSLTEKLYFTTAFNLLIGKGEVRGGYNPTYTSKIKELSLNFTPGLTYFFSQKWAISGTIGRIYYSERKKTIPKSNTGFISNSESEDTGFGVDASWNSFSIGLQYLINKNNKSKD